MPSPLSSALEHVKPTPLPDPADYKAVVAAAKKMAKACRSIDTTEFSVQIGDVSVTYLRHDRPRVPINAIEVEA